MGETKPPFDGVVKPIGVHRDEDGSRRGSFNESKSRLLLPETLYRSFDILHGGRYHK